MSVKVIHAEMEELVLMVLMDIPASAPREELENIAREVSSKASYCRGI